jgi:hypothetical protein
MIVITLRHTDTQTSPQEDKLSVVNHKTLKSTTSCRKNHNVWIINCSNITNKHCVVCEECFSFFSFSSSMIILRCPSFIHKVSSLSTKRRQRKKIKKNRSYEKQNSFSSEYRSLIIFNFIYWMIIVYVKCLLLLQRLSSHNILRFLSSYGAVKTATIIWDRKPILWVYFLMIHAPLCWAHLFPMLDVTKLRAMNFGVWKIYVNIDEEFIAFLMVRSFLSIYIKNNHNSIK